MKKTIHLKPKYDYKEQIDITLSGSKSESNRALILKSLYQPEMALHNLATAKDTQSMVQALASDGELINVGHAGTTMRFMAAYLAFETDREILLTGSARMKERPIALLVDSLRELGADISYEENEGCPPLRIKPAKHNGTEAVRIAGDTSSQYLSALMMIGAKFSTGLRIEIEGRLVSEPYLKMTSQLMQRIGLEVEWNMPSIYIKPATELKPVEQMTIESDWSSASYWYAMASALPDLKLRLKHLYADSLQGDSVLDTVYKNFGVHTQYEGADSIEIQAGGSSTCAISFDLLSCPDIAQTVAVSCVLLRRSVQIKGLQTLRIKETDRLQALETELSKFGVVISTTDEALFITHIPDQLTANVSIDTYDDHRMAMAFAPLATEVPITINDPSVVVKSYPDFWKDLSKCVEVK